MKTMSVTEFKSHALRAISEVSDTRETLILTKRGKPLVQVSPYCEEPMEMIPGKLRHLLEFEKDIVSPLGEDIWKASQ
ncbi:MAG: type II toxin-antitoxin system Phd/YefM family antitoxin [Candidatus Omnitrophica bacterium]|nr:type II toxin-antitoxin system Phd/YefM family antitoxin [Candidatus Omnitrophota bacterium]